MKVALALAETELTRQQSLLATNAISQSEFDQVKAERDAAIAARDAASANLELAQQDLDFCDVTTPIAGRVERTLIKQGNLVGDKDATLLTSVVDYDPIYVNFNISERQLLETSRRSDAERANAQLDLSSIKAFVRRATDDDFRFEGHLDYLDLGVDESTGTFKIRAVIPNPNFDLLPGFFVRVRIPLGTIEDAVLIPERSLAFDQGGRYVLVLGEGGLVERRVVEVGGKYGDLVVITEGLTGEESVIIDGLQRARPGGKVTPTERELDATAVEVQTVRDPSIEKGAEPGL
jgi:RND family efflux transporter MFP subunit